MEDKKYILTDEVIEYYSYKLYRVMAIKDFGNIHKGDLGGWVEDESNLSQKGECWIYDNAKVFDKAKIYGNAKVWGESIVHEKAKVYGNATLSGAVIVYNNARIYGDADVYGVVMIRGNAKVYGKARVCEKAEVYGDAKIYGNAYIYGFASICGDAEIKSNEDYTVYKDNWSKGFYFTWTRSNDKWKVGCFYGTGEELITKAYEDSEKSGKCYEAIVNVNKLISNID